MPGLEELGWLQFERLCELVLEADAGVDPTRWEGSADRCREVVCEDELHVNGRTLAPPVLVRCQWYREDPVVSPPPQFKSVVLFANRPLSGDVVYGEEELREAIRRLPGLRMKLPSILSLDAAPPDPDALGRSTFDIAATRELARVFVPTPAWSRAVAILKAHNFLVLTGPPEMGKTAIARMLGLALLTQGWQSMVLVIVVYTLLNSVVTTFVPAKFVGDAVGMSMTVTVASVAFWAWVCGPLGAVLAIPLSLLVKAIFIDAIPAARWLAGFVDAGAERRRPNPG